MDRNIRSLVWDLTGGVALRKESVDRNTRRTFAYVSYSWSLSARRAWIEIILNIHKKDRQIVALRKESVDRNRHHSLNLPSSPVALRKESVDRNFDAMQIVIVVVRRSPQGERG